MNNKVKISVVITFLIMVVVNILANTLPINGITTAEVSDYYSNLFAPTGLTFAIWGLIYLLLGAYSLYQLGLFKKDKKNDFLLNKVGILFTISSIANSIWIFAWHYDGIIITVIIMIIILFCLINIVSSITKAKLTTRERLFIRVPFSVYFGWITVATIANITTLLVKLGWNGFGLAEATWTVIIIFIGAVIGILTILKNKDFFYGLVIIWAYIGILIKHLSPQGFNGTYTQIITSVIVSIGLIVISEIYILVKKYN